MSMSEVTTNPSPFREKIQKLQAATEEGKRKIDAKERPIPTVVIVGAVIPFVLLLIFYVVQPGIVQKKEGDKFVRDNKKIFYWTVGLTLVAWAGLYFWSSYKGKSSI